MLPECQQGSGCSKYSAVLCCSRGMISLKRFIMKARAIT